MASRWRHVVAACVLWHAVAITLDATPDTSAGLKRAAWKEATVQDEFAAWAGILGVPEPTLEEHLWTFAVGWSQTRSTLIAPLHRYLGWAHARQSWQMFVAPHTTPSRLQIQEQGAGSVDVREDAAWTTLFEERDPEHAWMAGAFGVERMRASVFRWSWPGFEASYKRGCEALARLRFAESDTRAVRCRFYQVATPSPDQVLGGRAPQGKWVRTVVVPRSE